MTDTPEIERIRAALARYQAATTLTETLDAVGEFEDAACNSAAMTAVLAHIDAQAAEIELLRWTVRDALESLDNSMDADCRATLSAAIKETP